MLQWQNQLANPILTVRLAISATMVLITQFSLSLVPRFPFASSLLAQLSLSVVVLLTFLGLGGWLRRILGIHGSASTFVVITIIFIWCFYLLVIRQGVSLALDFVFNGQVIMLMTGLCRIQRTDPGFVLCENPSGDELVESSVSEVSIHGDEASDLGRRVRYCKSCRANIKGFDHHCPAFGNCIGQRNYLLFMCLLLGFLVIEASYVSCSSEYITKFGVSGRIRYEASLSDCLAFSTRMFAILQLVWQVPFLAWHVYCICFNIRTDEWINWEKYPEFHLIVQSQQVQNPTGITFTNPYDRGVLQNVKDFLLSSQR